MWANRVNATAEHRDPAEQNMGVRLCRSSLRGSRLFWLVGCTEGGASSLQEAFCLPSSEAMVGSGVRAVVVVIDVVPQLNRAFRDVRRREEEDFQADLLRSELLLLVFLSVGS